MIRDAYNLKSNAVKYTPAGGKISVRLVQRSGAPEGYGFYEIRVKDNGIGMSPEFAERVFESFERENISTISGIQGIGLGMAITKKLVDLMGGSISLETQKGVGTEFIVSLKLRLQNESEKNHRIESLDNIHALVVDDDFDICDSATRMLSDMGMRPEWTMSGKEAVLRAKHAKEIGDSFGVFIIDFRMPDISGIEVASIPIIAMTANAFDEDRRKAFECGMNGHLAKPLNAEEIVSTVSGFLLRGN